MLMSKQLSPTTRAVLDAYEQANDCYREEWGQLAAAFRAAADQLSDEMIVVGEGFKGLMRDDWSIIHTEDLLAIADEIEALQT